VYSLRYLVASALATALLSACGAPHGRPGNGSEPASPSEVMDFATLYSENCAGCHGTQGKGGAASALADPVYLAVIDDKTMRTVIATGVKQTSMPAFGANAGGLLTDKQIDVIANGIRSQWCKEGVLDGANPPSYTARTAGDVQRGETAYRTYCESCHGEDGKGGPKASAITNDSFLALISDQGLRTTVIAGRRELGAPDWRGNVPGKPMSDQEVTDVVGWLASHRVKNPGQPYFTSNKEQK
jgi:mono/diheme cytochrome c family protein